MGLVEPMSESFGPRGTHVRVLWASWNPCPSLTGLVEPMSQDPPNGGPSEHKQFSSHHVNFNKLVSLKRVQNIHIIHCVRKLVMHRLEQS